ncbi:hypothetical protein G6F57_020633 [Rhizopus arrhizus]|nr:hypothetical protein G6F57_020633 [Rhizopus arrhizus]
MTPSSITLPGLPEVPVPSAKIVSPSIIVWMGLMVRASPSWAMPAIFCACALVSVASVATTPMVVAVPGRMELGRSPARMAARVSSRCLPSGVRAPARMRPVAGSSTSPTAFTATIAPTVTPATVNDALPMPPFMARLAPYSLPTVAPAPAPTLPSCGAAVVADLQAW